MGRIAMVHRPDRFLILSDTMRQYNLAPKRIQFIYPKMGREANMPLIWSHKDGSTDGLKILPPLTVHKENGDHTDEIFWDLLLKRGWRWVLNDDSRG